MKTTGFRGQFRLPLLWLIVVVSYLALAKFCLSLGAIGGSASPFWMPTGLVMGLSLLLGYRVLPGIFIGQLLSGLLFEVPVWWVPIVEATGNVVEGAIFRFLALRYAGGENPLGSVRSFLGVLPGMMLGSSVNAVFGVGALTVSKIIAPAIALQTTFTWTMGDMGGALIVMPLLTGWKDADCLVWKKNRYLAEFGLVTFLTVSLSYITFFDTFGLSTYSLAFLLFPMLLWGAFRFDRCAVNLLNAVSISVAIAGTAQNHGPFATTSPVMSLTLLQIFTTILICTSLLVLLINRERRKMTIDIQQHAKELEHRVQIQTDAYRLANRELKEAVEKLTLSDRVFNETHEGIIITDTSNRIVDVNPAFCAITGYARIEVIGQTPRILRSGKQSPEFYTALWKTLGETGHWQGELWNRKKNGDIYAERLTISALRDDTGKVLHYVALFSDITQIKQQQDALKLMAHYDTLTQLPNRALFAERFKQAISHSRRESALLAVCYLDLDGFKRVNDTLGHDVGDQLLIEVAQRIQANLRCEDTLSRLGGDEFALLLNDLDSFELCERVLKRIHQAIAQPYLIKGQPVSVAASTGVTLYPWDDADSDTLLRHADQAMYLAKTSGRNRYRLFDSEHAQQLQHQSQQLKQIEDAFARNEFRLFYQPKVNMLTGEVVGLEALLRWNHPERGIVLPSAFLSIIEGNPFELVMGDWVIETALEQMENWKIAGFDINVSVNLAPRHLQDPRFFGTLGVILARHPLVPSQRLQLEVVESSVLHDLAYVSEVIQLCRNKFGVGFALDDFGTGYSSLTYLRRLPVDSVKIDQSFVRDMIIDPEDNAIVNGAIALAKAFNREVVAEGVETSEHGMELLKLGCYLAQGFGIARPMPADSVIGWVRSYLPHERWRGYQARR